SLVRQITAQRSNPSAMAVTRKQTFVGSQPPGSDDQRHQCAVLTRKPCEAGTTVCARRRVLRRYYASIRDAFVLQAVGVAIGILQTMPAVIARVEKTIQNGLDLRGLRGLPVG